MKIIGKVISSGSFQYTLTQILFSADLPLAIFADATLFFTPTDDSADNEHLYSVRKTVVARVWFWTASYFHEHVEEIENKISKNILYTRFLIAIGDWVGQQYYSAQDDHEVRHLSDNPFIESLSQW